jgi:hypothetical protein
LFLFNAPGASTPAARAIASLLCAALGLRYIFWRFCWAMPHGQAVWQQAWAWLFSAFEALSVMSSVTALVFMSRQP